jgi:hypothetical protein
MARRKVEVQLQVHSIKLIHVLKLFQNVKLCIHLIARDRDKRAMGRASQKGRLDRYDIRNMKLQTYVLINSFHFKVVFPDKENFFKEFLIYFSEIK